MRTEAGWHSRVHVQSCNKQHSRSSVLFSCEFSLGELGEISMLLTVRNLCLTHKKRFPREENERADGECLESGDGGPALHPVSERLQTDCWGPAKYLAVSEKQCSEARWSAVLGSKLQGSSSTRGPSKLDQETTELSCRAASCTWGTPCLSIVLEASLCPSGKNTCLNLQ